MPSAAWRPALVALNLTLLALIAFFAARITSTLVAIRLDRPVPHAAPAAPPAAAAATQPESAYAVVYERDVFDVQKAGAARTTSATDGKRTDLNVKLWGTAIGGDAAHTFAIIEDVAARRQALYQIGDVVLDTATLARVEWDRVILDRNGSEEVLELTAGRGPAGGTAASATTGVPAAGGEKIRKTGDDKFMIDRRELEKTVDNLNDVFTQARAVPFFQDWKTFGFRVFAIKPGSVFEKIGLQNGDVIQRVNGVELTDPTKAISLFTELQNEGHIAVDLKRNQQSKSFSYEIR